MKKSSTRSRGSAGERQSEIKSRDFKRAGPAPVLG
jgi:hypothetical protein